MKQSCLTYEGSGKAWVTWGNVLHQQLINAELKGGNSAADIDKRCAVYLLYSYESTNTDAAAAGRTKLSQEAINCYLQGVKHNCDNARMLLSKVLWIMDQYEDLPTIGQVLTLLALLVQKDKY